MKDDINIVGIVIQLRECGIKGSDEKVMEKDYLERKTGIVIEPHEIIIERENDFTNNEISIMRKFSQLT